MPVWRHTTGGGTASSWRNAPYGGGGAGRTARFDMDQQTRRRVARALSKYVAEQRAEAEHDAQPQQPQVQPAKPAKPRTPTQHRRAERRRQRLRLWGVAP